MGDIGVCVCILGWHIAQPLPFIAGLIVVFFFWAGADGATGAGDWLIPVVAPPPPLSPLSCTVVHFGVNKMVFTCVVA